MAGRGLCTLVSGEWTYSAVQSRIDYTEVMFIKQFKGSSSLLSVPFIQMAHQAESDWEGEKI